VRVSQKIVRLFLEIVGASQNYFLIPRNCARVPGNSARILGTDALFLGNSGRVAENLRTFLEILGAL
jgi:hypothetical protein